MMGYGSRDSAELYGIPNWGGDYFSVNNAGDILKYPQLQARKFWKEIEHPGIGTLKYPGGAVVTTQGYVGVRKRAPRIGEHNGEIYNALGLAAGEQQALQKEKVI